MAQQFAAQAWPGGGHDEMTVAVFATEAEAREAQKAHAARFPPVALPRCRGRAALTPRLGVPTCIRPICRSAWKIRRAG